MERKMNVSFYTRNEMVAYNVRNKCKTQNIEMEYLSDLGEMLEYLISNKGGVVIIDLKYFKHSKLISEYCNIRNCGKYRFVYLVENENEFENTCEDIEVFSYEEISQLISLLPKILEDLNAKNISNQKNCVSNAITEILESYKISPKHIGFNYLKDCIDLSRKCKTGCLDLSKNIYPNIAKMYNTTEDNVEKNIRIAIKSASLLHPELYDEKTFCDGKVTNRKFVSHIIQEVDIAGMCELKEINAF